MAKTSAKNRMREYRKHMSDEKRKESKARNSVQQKQSRSKWSTERKNVM